jgi:hypothetical protein
LMRVIKRQLTKARYHSLSHDASVTVNTLDMLLDSPAWFAAGSRQIRTTFALRKRVPWVAK